MDFLSQYTIDPTLTLLRGGRWSIYCIKVILISYLHTASPFDPDSSTYGPARNYTTSSRQRASTPSSCASTKSVNSMGSSISKSCCHLLRVFVSARWHLFECMWLKHSKYHWVLDKVFSMKRLTTNTLASPKSYIYIIHFGMSYLPITYRSISLLHLSAFSIPLRLAFGVQSVWFTVFDRLAEAVLAIDMGVQACSKVVHEGIELSEPPDIGSKGKNDQRACRIEYTWPWIESL